MDDIVRQAMKKWPQVPSCYGWLGLDRRGDWYLRDARAQAVGAFQSGLQGAKGSRLEHAGLKDFIERNYASDERGFWYFQNGPQRVFVELEATPWIVRIGPDFHLCTHDGRAVAAHYGRAGLALRGNAAWIGFIAQSGHAAGGGCD